MNLYESTGKKLENWPQWVRRLTDENEGLRRKIIELEKQLMEEMSKS